MVFKYFYALYYPKTMGYNNINYNYGADAPGLWPGILQGTDFHVIASGWFIFTDEKSSIFALIRYNFCVVFDYIVRAKIFETTISTYSPNWSMTVWTSYPNIARILIQMLCDYMRNMLSFPIGQSINSNLKPTFSRYISKE